MANAATGEKAKPHVRCGECQATEPHRAAAMKSQEGWQRRGGREVAMLDRKNSKGEVRWSVQEAPCDEATRALRNRILAFTLQDLSTLQG